MVATLVSAKCYRRLSREYGCLFSSCAAAWCSLGCFDTPTETAATCSELSARLDMEGQAADVSLVSPATATEHSQPGPAFAKPAYAGPLKPHGSSQRLATEVAKANMDWSLATELLCAAHVAESVAETTAKQKENINHQYNALRWSEGAASMTGQTSSKPWHPRNSCLAEPSRILGSYRWGVGPRSPTAGCWTKELYRLHAMASTTRLAQLLGMQTL